MSDDVPAHSCIKGKLTHGMFNDEVRDKLIVYNEVELALWAWQEDKWNESNMTYVCRHEC
jgi:hypothetical protein